MKKQMKQLKDRSTKELEKEEQKLRQEIGKLILEQKVSPPKNTNVIHRRKKTLAVVLTVLHAKRELERLQTKSK